MHGALSSSPANYRLAKPQQPFAGTSESKKKGVEVSIMFQFGRGN